MPELAIDLVRSFAGYLHLDSLMEKASIHFEAGIHSEQNESLVSSTYETVVYPQQEIQTIVSAPTIIVTFSPSVESDIKNIASSGFLPANFKIAVSQHSKNVILPSTKPIATLEVAETKTSAGPASDATSENLKITPNYAEVETQNETIEGSNENGLSDNDIFVAGDRAIDGPNIDIDQMIAEMIQIAGNEIPQSAYEIFDTQPARENEFQYDSNLETEGTPGGRIENTEPQTPDLEKSSDDQGYSESAGDASEGIKLFEDFNESGLEDTFAQTASLGGNTVVNGAFLIDSSESFGGTIISGDYHETNAIYQVIVLIDNDEIRLSDVGEVGSLITHDNTQYNEASFDWDTQPAIEYTANGVLPGTTWNIDYVNGDFYDITTVFQASWVADNDIAHLTAAQSHFAASLGGNILVDISELYNFGASNYDLLIVGGNYYEVNAIYQTNILLENDFIEVIQSGNGSEKLEIDASDNEQTNFAQIVNLGGHNSFQDFSDEVEDLVDDIEDGETEFKLSLDFAATLPGDGADDFSVLFISGDYFDYNLIEQWNVAADVDLTIAEGWNRDAESIEDAAYDINIQSGGNELINTAVIVDIDNLSEFQILGGEYYEDTMLVQANIIQDKDEVVISEQSHEPESLILANNLDNSGPENLSGVDNSGPGNADNDDVLPGVWS